MDNFQLITIKKQCPRVPQVPQKLSSLKSPKIQNSPPTPGFLLLQPSEMASLSNSSLQKRKKGQNS